MKIIEVSSRVFTYQSPTSQADGHTHPVYPDKTREAKQAVLTITSDEGISGHVISAPAYVTDELVSRFLRPTLVGRDPLERESIWQTLYKLQRGSSGLLNDRVLCAAELALWDLIGKTLGQPVWKLAGGYRSKVLAYGSTMCGDQIEGGLRTADDYARFAEWLVRVRGYRAIKLHTWMPPVPGAPDIRKDVAACEAVREAVGPDIPVMLDPSHWYSRQDALWLGQQLERLNYLWMEEVMEEASLSAYQWLSSNLKLNILGPETMQGKYWTRAEWASKNACDMLRTGVWDVGGLGPALKCAHLAESFHMNCEVHGAGAANLALCAAIPNTTYFERGLLHPLVDYEQPPAFLNRIDDEMDQEGYVHLRTTPGLGQDINFGYIDDHLV